MSPENPILCVYIYSIILNLGSLPITLDPKVENFASRRSQVGYWRLPGWEDVFVLIFFGDVAILLLTIRTINTRDLIR